MEGDVSRQTLRSIHVPINSARVYLDNENSLRGVGARAADFCGYARNLWRGIFQSARAIQSSTGFRIY